MDIRFIVVLLQLTFGPCLGAHPYFWHITDFHFDPTYLTTQDSCNDAIANPGRYGDFECDPPYELLRSAVQAMRDAGNEPTFILYSGDTVLHPKNYSVVNTPYVINMLQNSTDLFVEYFPDTKFVVTLGNHDYYPNDQLPGGQRDPVYNATAEMWAHWFTYSESISETFNRGGYYTMMIDHVLKLRVVVPNTNLYLKSNEATARETDPAGQYAWLRDVLKSARINNEKVHLVTHVPSGVMNTFGSPRWLRETDNTKFNDIVREFHDVIVGYYSCHEHQDSFRLYYKDDIPVSVLLVAPSVTPWRARIGNNIRAAAHNPAVRKIIYDETNGQLLDIEQYYLDLTAANGDQSPAVWKLLYSFRDLYGVNQVTPTTVHELVQRIKSDDSIEFTKFREMTLVKTNHSSISSSCGCSCKYLHVCSMEYVEYSEFNECIESATCSADYLRSPAWLLGLFILFKL